MMDISHISKIYNEGTEGAYTALSDVSFHIGDNEFVAIMGPSGSGKSTLMNILGALDTPSKGTFTLNNKNIESYTEDELAIVRRHTIGFIFQSFNLLARTTVLENVSLPLIYSEVTGEERKKRAQAALRMAGLPEKYDHHLTNQISGGQVQRVAIARALVNNPAVILADEPTGNLDSKTGELVLQTFRDLHEKEKKTIIVITHDKNVAAHTDRTIVIRDGTIESDTKNKRV